jgi:hypothetical protein
MMGTTDQPVAPVNPLLRKAFWEADGNRTRQGAFAPSSDLKSVTSTRHAVASTRQASDPCGSSDPHGRTPDGSGPRMLSLRVPEPKTAKNRMHLDINIVKRCSTHHERRDQVDIEVEMLTGLGATNVSSFDEDKGVWTVMLDPEGNEFCVR